MAPRMHQAAKPLSSSEVRIMFACLILSTSGECHHPEDETHHVGDSKQTFVNWEQLMSHRTPKA